MKIKELPKLERPYEKLENYGAERLSDAELIAIIIKTGTNEKTSVQLAQQLLKLDVEKRGISFLKDISLQEIQRLKGLGRVKAIQLKAIGELSSRIITKSPVINNKIKTPEDIKDMFMYEMKDLKQEILKCILLDTRKHIIRVVTISIGGLNSNFVEMRDIFKEPIKSCADSIALIHNHPSGDPTPSDSDINFTKRVVQAGELLDINVLDHIIIGNGVFCSLRRMNKF